MMSFKNYLAEMIITTRQYVACKNISLGQRSRSQPALKVCASQIHGGGRVVRWSWVNFQCRGVLQFGCSRARAYCACNRCGWGLFGHFTLLYPFSPLSPSLWETARYRLKYCLKGPLNPKQPTNQPRFMSDS